MKKRIMRGLVQSVILLVGITFLSFLLSWLSPGDAAERMLKKSGMMVTEEQLEAKREELGLNKPLLIQYKDWMINLCKGDRKKKLLQNWQRISPIRLHLQQYPCCWLS